MFVSWWEPVSHLNQILKLGFWDSDVLHGLLKHILISNVPLSRLIPVTFSNRKCSYASAVLLGPYTVVICKRFSALSYCSGQ